MFTFFECFGCRCTKPFQCLDTKIANGGFGFLHSKFFYFEVLIIEAIEQEVQKIRNNSFGAFAFQQDLPDGCWPPGRNFTRISPTTPTRGFFISNSLMLLSKSSNNLTAQFLEFTSGRISVRDRSLCRLSSISHALHLLHRIRLRKGAVR